MQNYLDLLQNILDTGIDSSDRTGVGTKSIFGAQLRFDLTKGFPAVTTKKLAWKAVVSELLWFLEGSNDERRLAEILYGTRDPNKKTIWTANAEADYWKPKARFTGDLGEGVYGKAWRNWPKPDGTTVDQIDTLINGLKNDPYSRRHILMGFNPGMLDQVALPPCHVMSQFYVRNGSVSCMMTQRSCDVFLGLSFNIASYALLTHMIAQVCDLEVKELIISIGDAHIYSNHIDQVKEQLSRTPYELPKLELNPNVTDINNFKMADCNLIDYKCHSTIKADMAV